MVRSTTLIIVLSLSLLALGCSRDSWQNAPPPPPHPPEGGEPRGGGMGAMATIKATGTATKHVAPDVAYLMTVIETPGDDVGAAKAAHVAKMTEVLKVAKAGGVEAANIRTGRSLIEGVYGDSTRDRVLERYRVSQEVQLTIKELDKVEVILQSLIETKAITTWDVSFQHADAKTIKSAVLEEAVKNAREKATVMAAVMEHVPGPPVSVTEMDSSRGGGPMGPNKDKAPVVVDFFQSTKPTPGLIPVEAQVEVVFALTE